MIGGQRDPTSNFIAPTVMSGVNADDHVMKEEIFGPVLPIINVNDQNDAIDYINSRYWYNLTGKYF